MTNKSLTRGQLAWIRHPTMDSFNRLVKRQLVRILGVILVDKLDIEYQWVDVDGDLGHCYSAWLSPISALEAMALELYGKVPPDARDAS